VIKILLFTILIGPLLAFGYPQFIGYGYSSCLTCHYNAQGNGPLTDYGRMLAAAEIAGRILGPSNPDALAEQSGFLGTTQLPWWWRPSIGYRGLQLNRSLGQSVPPRYIHMQADFTNVFRFDENDRVVAVVNFGYAPIPYNVSNKFPQAQRNWISREHYIRMDAGESWHFYLGLMDKAYGIRIPDHEAYSRRATYNSQNDQVHGLMINFNSTPVEITLHGFLGNLQQEKEAQQKGGALNFEIEPTERVRLGLTSEYLTNDYANLIAGALTTKWGVDKGSAILFELGTTNLKPKTLAGKTGFYTFLQPYIKLTRGLHFFMTNEYYTENVSDERTRYLRWGPGFQYFPAQRFEFRVEAWNERSFNPESVRKDDWSLLSQVHLWL